MIWALCEQFSHARCGHAGGSSVSRRCSTRIDFPAEYAATAQCSPPADKSDRLSQSRRHTRSTAATFSPFRIITFLRAAAKIRIQNSLPATRHTVCTASQPAQAPNSHLTSTKLAAIHSFLQRFITLAMDCNISTWNTEHCPGECLPLNKIYKDSDLEDYIRI